MVKSLSLYQLSVVYVIFIKMKELREKTYELSSDFPQAEKYSLTSQIRRSSILITANIAESSGRYHYKDKINFLFNARGLLDETRSHLIMAKRLEYLSPDSFSDFEKDVIKLKKKLNSFINSLRRQHQTSNHR